MDDIIIARGLHVLAVVFWVGDVGFATYVVMPSIRRHHEPVERLAAFHKIEGLFVLQARF